MVFCCSFFRVFVVFFVGTLSLLGWWYILYQFLLDQEGIGAFAWGFLTFFCLPFGLASIVQLLGCALHLGLQIKLKPDGLVFSRYFSSKFIPWDRLLVYRRFNSLKGSKWFSFYNLASVSIEDQKTGKFEVLWPFLIPDLYRVFLEFEKKTLKDVFPNMIFRNEKIHFGPISIDSKDIFLQNKNIPLNSFLKVKINADSLTLFQRGTSEQILISLKKVPNYHLLYYLILKRCSNLVHQGNF